MGMNEKTGVVFSVAAENAPVPLCTVSKAVAEVAGGYVAHFSLAAGTDISAETYTAPSFLRSTRMCWSRVRVVP